MVENNPHKISTMGQGGSLAAITDASDFPHTGLIKGLSLMARQNIVVKNNSNDFDITQSTANSGTVAVSAGTYLRDGKLYTAQYKTGTTAASFTFGSSELITTYDKGYHLVVVDKNNFILIRKPTVANKVPDYTSGDTIIAIVEYSSTTSSGARNIQFLTTDKTENSVSIAYDNSNVYTEASAITGTSAGLFVSGIGTATVASDDKVLIQDTGSSDVIKSVTAASIAALAPQGDITGVDLSEGAGIDIASETNTASGAYSATINLDLTEVIASDGANRVLTSDGDGTLTGEANMSFDGSTLTVTGDAKVTGNTFQSYIDFGDDLAIGWYTFAVIEGRSGGSGSGTGGSEQRGIGSFTLREDDSSRHQTVKLTASHLFGGGNSNGISIEHSSFFSTLGIQQFRIKENSTYDGAALQVYLSNATNDIDCFLQNNFQNDGWILITPVADASDPSTGTLGLGYNNAYSDLVAGNTINLDTTGISGRGSSSAGAFYVNGQIRVDGQLLLKEISAPSNSSSFGQLYTNADNELHLIDGAGTDTVLLKSGKHSIWVPSSAMTPTTSAGCSALTQVEMTAGRPELQVLDFAADADDHAQFTVAFPKSWNEGTVTFQPFWTVTGTNTGTAVWELTGLSANDSYVIDSGYPAVAATGAKAHSGTSNDLNVSAESGALTITNASVDSVTFFRLNLKVAASSQSGVVRLIGLKMFYDINAGNDE